MIDKPTTAELLKTVTGCLDPYDRLIKAVENDLMRIRKLSQDELASIGFSKPGAEAIIALGELLHRARTPEIKSNGEPATSNSIALALQSEIGIQDQEHMVVILLDNRNAIRPPWETVYIGNCDGIDLITPALVLAPAVRRNCTSIVIAHNHPSNNVRPTEEDLYLTKELIKAANIMGIRINDHIIVGRTRHYSMLEHRVGGFED